MSELYNLPNIRNLLTNGFDDAELRALCFDLPDFRPVYDQFTQNTGKAEIVAKLVEYAERKDLLDTLLAWAQEHNSTQYEKYKPYCREDSISPASRTREQQYEIALHWAELGRRHSLARFDLSERDLRAVDLSSADLRGSTWKKRIWQWPI